VGSVVGAVVGSFVARSAVGSFVARDGLIHRLVTFCVVPGQSCFRHVDSLLFACATVDGPVRFFLISLFLIFFSELSVVLV
jgi:hypothetical protein